MKDQLTEKQEKFTQEYLTNGGNATQAYVVAYDTSNMKPETINRTAKDLIDNHKITARLAEYRKTIQEDFGITTDVLLTELEAMKAYGNQSAEIFDKDGTPTGIFRKVDVRAVLDAIEKQAKIIGAYERDNRQKPAQVVMMPSVFVGGKELEFKVGKEPPKH